MRALIGGGGTGLPPGGGPPATGALLTAGGKGAGGAMLAVGGKLGIARLRPGRAATATPWCATFITRLQMSTGRPPPVALRVGEESSLPIQTPVMRWAV